MQRTLELRIKTPEIHLASWLPTDQDALKFPFKRDKVAGTISLNLDRDAEAVEWDFEVDEDGEGCRVPICCERIIVRIEGKYVGDEVTETEFLKIAQVLTAEYVNKLLLFIRAELGQYWVKPVYDMSRWNLNYFLDETDARWVSEQGEVAVVKRGILVPPGASRFYGRSAQLDESGWESIRRLIQQGQEPDLMRRLIANAREHFEDGDHRMAAVEAITALESKLKSFVRRRCKARGISHNKFDSTDQKLYLSDYLKVLLPLNLDKDELDAWVQKQLASLSKSSLPIPKESLNGKLIIERCITLNKIRNDIVHGQKIALSADDIKCIKQGLEAVEWLLAFIEEAESGGQSNHTT